MDINYRVIANPAFNYKVKTQILKVRCPCWTAMQQH